MVKAQRRGSKTNRRTIAYGRVVLQQRGHTVMLDSGRANKNGKVSEGKVYNAPFCELEASLVYFAER